MAQASKTRTTKPRKTSVRGGRKKSAKKTEISRKTQYRLIIVFLTIVLVFVFYSDRLYRKPGNKPVAVEQALRPPPSSTPRTPARTSPSARTGAKPASDGQFRSDGLEIPHMSDQTFFIVNRKGRYSLHYDTTYRQAAWVAYVLTRSDVTTKGASRNNHFVPDAHVVKNKWPSAADNHYTKSGYDRGHLLPSADRSCTQAENDATFSLANISPQCPALNRRVWKNLETKVRQWAETHDSLYVVTGGVLEKGLPRIRGGVGVPRYFYKAILVKCDGRYQATAFLIPNNEQVRNHYMGYMITVDSLESVIGHDLFHRLPDSIEHRVEKEYDLSFWR